MRLTVALFCKYFGADYHRWSDDDLSDFWWAQREREVGGTDSRHERRPPIVATKLTRKAFLMAFTQVDRQHVKQQLVTLRQYKAPLRLEDLIEKLNLSEWKCGERISADWRAQYLLSAKGRLEGRTIIFVKHNCLNNNLLKTRTFGVIFQNVFTVLTTAFCKNESFGKQNKISDKTM